MIKNVVYPILIPIFDMSIMTKTKKTKKWKSQKTN